MKCFRYICSVFLVFFVYSASSQIYNEGQDAWNVRYEVLKTPSYKLIYPRQFKPEALRLSSFIDTISPNVSYGIKKPYYSFPIILYTSYQNSNGMVSLLPSRVDLFMTPSVSMTSTPWYSQLAIHEYRHAAQMSALRTGVLNGARYALGELAGSIGLAVVPKWFLEGDATNAETQLVEYGRGLQPSFTIEYRAMMTDEAKKPFSKYMIDNLIIGSYNYHIPDYYKFGYHMVRSYETKIASTFAGDFLNYAGRNPYMISPLYFYTRKHGLGTVSKMAKMTFAKLDSLWRPFSRCDNNYRYLTNSKCSYTEYQYPIPLDSCNTIIHKKSMDEASHFVLFNANKEKKLCFTGSLSSRPVIHDSVIYWTEYKNDIFYELKSSSVIRSFSLKNKFFNNYRKDVNSYLLTPLNQGWATLRYDSLLHANIVLLDSHFKDIDTISFGKPTSIHGMAYEKSTNKIYFIAVDDDGMWIGSVDTSAEQVVNVVKKPSSVTLSDLSASSGKLYFGSIQSGKDEIHMIDLVSGKEFQLTKSKLGARQPVQVGQDSILLAGYSVKGWNIAKASNLENDSIQVTYQKIPDTILNPDFVKWQIPRRQDSSSNTSCNNIHKIKRYRRASDMFHFHSWVPGVAADVDEIVTNYSSMIGFGATGMFQSNLGDFQGYATIGSKEGKYWMVGSFDYLALPVKFSLYGEYGGGMSKVYIPNGQSYDVGKYGELGYASKVAAKISMPMDFSSYSVTRKLTPVVNYVRTGDLIYDEDNDSFITGLDSWNASISYSSIKSCSQRCLSPRLGIFLKIGAQGAIHNKFSKIYYSQMTAYLPGIFKNHSFAISGSTQYQHLEKYGFFSKVAVPLGIIDDNVYQKYHYSSIIYKFPLCYPDWGIDRYLFFKRIYTEFFGEYSIGIFPKSSGYSNVENISYGIGIGLDLSALTSFEQNIKIRLAFPNSKRTYVAFLYSFTL